MKNKMIKEIEGAMWGVARPEKVAGMKRFLQILPGGYGEGDQVMGVMNPEVRRLVRVYRGVELEVVSELISHPLHELRLLGLLILVEQVKKAKAEARETMVQLYLRQTQWINNWDLVDLSAPGILGVYLKEKPREILWKLAKSGNLWQQRIAIVSTLTLIRAGEFADAVALAEAYLGHPHDLIHKASGWVLREIGKRDRTVLRHFLEQHWNQMPRTMLRYAIEHLPEDERKAWLQKRI